MNFIFVFILPSIFGFKLIHANVDKNNKLNLIMYGGMLLLINNLLTSILVLLKNSDDFNIVYSATNSVKLSITYIFLSIFIGCIVGLVITIFDKYLNINVEVKHEKKKSTKNSK